MLNAITKRSKWEGGGNGYEAVHPERVRIAHAGYPAVRAPLLRGRHREGVPYEHRARQAPYMAHSLRREESIGDMAAQNAAARASAAAGAEV